MKFSPTSDLVLKKSGIHNKGVFARKNIPIRTTLIEYIGRKITKIEAKAIEKESMAVSKKNSSVGKTYIFELDEVWSIDGDVPENYARFINHSCDPNCYYFFEDGHIWIESEREIKKGEEVTYNYGFGLEKDFRNHPCKCGSKNCVGYILDEEYWPRLNKILNKENKSKNIKK